MLPSANDLTIAVTVYDRREFVLGAVASALNQTVPVRVMVVEDCSPDNDLRDTILARFSGRIRYVRNEHNRGLFDNWNACMEQCQTPWLSILHDDDLLHPNFVETMLGLAQTAPNRALYFGRAGEITAQGHTRSAQPVSWQNNWRAIESKELAEICFLIFPGQVFHVDTAQKLGGFRKYSHFTGDWDLWFRLTLQSGAAQSGTEVSVVRTHDAINRGSCRVEKMGWKWALDNVQRKRNLALLNEKLGTTIPFIRTRWLAESPVPSRILLRHGAGFSPRFLKYNTWLFTHSSAPNFSYGCMQLLAKAGGPNLVKVFSHVWRLLNRRAHY